MNGFLRWLELQIGSPIDDLTGKSALQNYLGDYQRQEPHLDLDRLLDILGKNRRRVKVDLLSRSFTTALEREYGASLDKLLPIKRNLAETDALIDQIVYRLYGLNEGEIAVVEGKR